MRLFLIIFIVLSTTIGFSQAPLTYYLDDSAWEYSVVTPPGKAKGLIVFLPSFSQPSRNLLEEVKFQNLAYMYGLTTLIIPGGAKLYADKEVTKMITEAVTKVMKDHDIPKNKVVFGGFSAGGTIALRYAQYCISFPYDYPANPQAVFIVDSPVSLPDFHAYCEREIAKNYTDVGVTEAKYVKSIMERDLGGSPAESPEKYAQMSPYNSDQPYGGNTRILQHIAVRSYHDPDVQWQITNRRRSFLDMNVLYSSEMINQLQVAGNKKAEIILKPGAGVRKNGERNPHSMSIVDEEELITWILKQLEIPYNAELHKAFKNVK